MVILLLELSPTHPAGSAGEHSESAGLDWVVVCQWSFRAFPVSWERDPGAQGPFLPGGGVTAPPALSSELCIPPRSLGLPEDGGVLESEEEKCVQPQPSVMHGSLISLEFLDRVGLKFALQLFR